MNYAVVLDKKNSRDIFTQIKRGERFFISYLMQDIKIDDYLYLCSYYTFDGQENLLSVIKCKIISFELSEKKDDCMFKTPKSHFRIELEYACDQRLTISSKFDSRNKFRSLYNTDRKDIVEKLPRIFNLNFD